MFRDPLAVYRLPRESQVEILALLQADNPGQVEDQEDLEGEELEASDYFRIGRRPPASTVTDDGPREYDNPDPDQGARLPRDPGVQAVNTDARRRHDRFRVA